jgi:CubicO group peptidase (beta-lactamase class C family)
MRQPWAGWAKIFVTKNKLRREFEAYHEKYGSAIIDTVTYTSQYEYVAKLKMEKDKNARLYFKFIFSDKGRIEGFGESYPSLVYKKCVSPKAVNPLQFSEKVDSLMSQKYLKNEGKQFNGSVMVLDNGKPIFKKSYGHADFNLKTEINDSTLFDLGSVTKQFTSMAVLFLEENGKLNLNDSIQKFIPDFPYHGITIENLMTHTSGLPDYMDLLYKVWDKTKFATNYDVVDALIKHKPKVLFPPGQRFEYSNTGYLILSVIIEKASGKTYSAYLNESIFKPLGMNHTRVYNTRRLKDEKLNNCALGYVYSHEKKKYVLPDSLSEYRHVIYQDEITGDGSLNSCLQDLLLWENELLNPKLINKNILQKAISNRTTVAGEYINYGYGFFITGGIDCESLVYHTGGWPGYLSLVMNFFEQKKQIIVLSNNSFDNFTRIGDDIAYLLLEN